MRSDTKHEKITSEEQLRRWVDGEPVHRDEELLEGGECCPDFSCCVPELLASPEVRQAFVAASQRDRMQFLGTFLGAALAHASTDKEVMVVGPGDPGEAS